MLEPVRVNHVCLLLVAMSCFAGSLQAVVIDSGDGSGNTTAAGSFADPFAHVGRRGSGTGVYLGNGVVLTANHVGAGTIVFGGINYTAQPGTEQRLHAPGAPGSLVDLELYQIFGDTGLGTLDIGSVSNGTAVRMAGNGFDRQVDQTDWDVTVIPGDDNDIWTVVSPPPPSDKHGYEKHALETRSNRWGENTVEATGQLKANTLTYFTDFDNGESQAVSHDSGGGVFVFNGASWDLAGMMIGVDLEDNQPGGTDTAIFGNLTYFADLSQYADQIEDYIAAVPPPLPGDINLDGQVDGLDLNILGQNWQGIGTVWATGDLNGDGTTDGLDLNILGSNWQLGVPAPTPSVTIPEPATLTLFGIGAIVMLRRRQKRLKAV
jgi:hypothetical protein